VNDKILFEFGSVSELAKKYKKLINFGKKKKRRIYSVYSSDIVIVIFLLN